MKNLTLYVTAFLLVVLDQITKMMVKGFSLFGFDHQGMYIGESFNVLGDFLRITFVENPGMAFGVEFGTGKIFLTLFSLIASFGLIYYLHICYTHNWYSLSLPDKNIHLAQSIFVGYQSTH